MLCTFPRLSRGSSAFDKIMERKVKNRTTAKTSYVIHFSTKEDFPKNA